MGKTLYRKIWDDHVVKELDDGLAILYVDRQMVHEVTSPQAFEGLRLAGRTVRRPDLNFATMDHNVPTCDRENIKDPISKAQVEALEQNCAEYGIQLFGLDSDSNGIVHIIGPELGIILPGNTVVCGDSHTGTHGALGTIAFGIGTSEVEHVLATQTILQRLSKTFKVEFTGKLPPHARSKDMILRLIGEIGAAGGTGYTIEYCGEAVEALSMEARMTICNMSIEAGARTGIIAPDETTIDYLCSGDRPYLPRGAQLEELIAFWRKLKTDPDAEFDRVHTIDVSNLAPQVTWGTSPGMVADVDGCIPDPGELEHYKRQDVEESLAYMGLEPGMRMEDLELDVVFIGSCTNARIEDLREAAAVMQGRKVSARVHCLVVPGSMRVKAQAEAEGLDQIFIAAGAEWRDPGCSMCLAMNPDRLREGERCASTSNRNFVGRQGKGGRTHLVSPPMAAAAAVNGRITDIRKEI
jgi:3-isopropylmalate/(R)-2-methylmalate dehydratase large subunit